AGRKNRHAHALGAALGRTTGALSARSWLGRRRLLLGGRAARVLPAAPGVAAQAARAAAPSLVGSGRAVAPHRQRRDDGHQRRPGRARYDAARLGRLAASPRHTERAQEIARPDARRNGRVRALVLVESRAFPLRQLSAHLGALPLL